MASGVLKRNAAKRRAGGIVRLSGNSAGAQEEIGVAIEGAEFGAQQAAISGGNIEGVKVPSIVREITALIARQAAARIRKGAARRGGR